MIKKDTVTFAVIIEAVNILGGLGNYTPNSKALNDQEKTGPETGT